MERPDIRTIQKLILDFQSQDLPPLTARECVLPVVKHMALSIVGARRSGKTFRTYQRIAEFVCDGGDMCDVCRIQFNDHRLSNLQSAHLSVIDDAFHALYPDRPENRPILFIFDEIHRVSGWEDYILSLLDKPGRQVVITGSTSKLLRGEIATGLRGKNLSIELLPFSFGEFLTHYRIRDDAISSAGQARLRKAFSRYMEQGGFPGLLDLSGDQHINLLQSYWDTMVIKDVIEAHGDDRIHVNVLEQFAQELMSRIGRPFSIKKIMAEMHEAGHSFGTDLLYRYFRYFEEAFMLFPVLFHSPSPRVRSRNYIKVYAADWALANAVTPGGGIDPSRTLENIVYLHLRRTGHAVTYYKTRKNFEIDFVAMPKKPRQTPSSLYQVSLRLDTAETLERELRGIPETMRFLKIEKAYIITLDDERDVMIDGITVHIVPVWKWLSGHAG